MQTTPLTALALVPGAKDWPAIQKYRFQYDSDVRQWPPHIKIIFPFVFERSEFEDAAYELAQATSTLAPLCLRFCRLGTSGSTAYMIPECGADPDLRQLHAACAKALPGLPLRSWEFTPQLQVAQFKSELDALAFTYQCPDFDIETEVSCLSLLARDSEQHAFRTVVSVPLGRGWEGVRWVDGAPYLFRALAAAPKEILVYTALALALDIRGSVLSPLQLEELRGALTPVLEGDTPEFGLAVACWVRDKREIGNRLLPIHILVECARHPRTRAFVREAAPKILLIPSDLTEAFALCQIGQRVDKEGSQETKEAAAIPSCLKKAGKDMLEKMTEFHAAKYDSQTSGKRLRQVVRDCDAMLAGNALREVVQSGKSDSDKGKGKSKGKRGKGKGKGNGKRMDDEALTAKRDAALQRLRKLRSAELPRLLRICHPQGQHELMQKIMHKRYPVSEARFNLANQRTPEDDGPQFDPAQADTHMRLTKPATWDRELSKKGNIPPTWRDLLVAEPFELGMTALLRNLRNILQMGFAQPFLEKYVFRRVAGGAGASPVVLAQTLSQMKTDFPDEKLAAMQVESLDHKHNILTYWRLEKRIRCDMAGREDVIKERVERFLGMPLSEGLGLRRVSGCYLKLETAEAREGSGVFVTKARSVPACPPDRQVIEAMDRAFVRGIERSGDHGVKEIPGAKSALLWVDLAPPSIGAGTAASGLAAGERSLCGQGPEVPAVATGRPVLLEQVLASPLLNLEHSMVGIGRGSLPEVFVAYDWEGREVFTGREWRSKKGELIGCFSASEGRANEDAPLQTAVYLDLSRIGDDIFAVAVTSTFTIDAAARASVCLREVPEQATSELLGGTFRAAFDRLTAGQSPLGKFGALRGRPRFGVSLLAGSEKPASNGGKGKGKGKAGTPGAVRTCVTLLHRSPRGDSKKWLFRQETPEGGIFSLAGCRTAEAALTQKDPDIPAMLRVCQLRKAFELGGGSARCVMTGLQWGLEGEPVPGAIEVPLKGALIEDIAAIREAKAIFVDKALAGKDGLAALARAAGGARPDILVRVGNVPDFPVEAVPAHWRGAVKLCALDMQGQLAMRPDLLLADDVTWLPGNVESSPGMLRSALESGGDLVGFVQRFGPKGRQPLEGQGSGKKEGGPATVPQQLKGLQGEAEVRKAAALEAAAKSEEDWGACVRELEHLKKQHAGHRQLARDFEQTLDTVRRLGSERWERERQPGGLIAELKQHVRSCAAAGAEFKRQKASAEAREPEAAEDLARARREWRLQEDTLRAIAEPAEATKVRRKLRCRYTNVTAMEALLGSGLRVGLSIGREVPVPPEDPPSDTEDGECVAEYLRGREAGELGSAQFQAADQGREQIVRVRDALCRADLFSFDAYQSGRARLWPDDRERFAFFLPLALEGMPTEYYNKAKISFLALKESFDEAKQNWLETEKERLQVYYKDKDSAFAEAKRTGSERLCYPPPPTMPIWLREAHLPKRLGGALGRIAAAEEEEGIAEVCLELFPALLHGVLQSHLETPSDALLQLFCVLQHTFAAVCRENSALRAAVAAQVEGFVAEPRQRHKDRVPDLGRFLQLFPVHWAGLWSAKAGAAVAEELLMRQAPTFLDEIYLAASEDEQGRLRREDRKPWGKGVSKGAELADRELEVRVRLPRAVMDFGGLLPESTRYLEEKWRGGQVGSCLVLFLQHFADTFGAAVAGGAFAAHYGRPTWAERRGLPPAPPDYLAFAGALHGFPSGGGGEAPIAAALLGAVELARDRGYYRDRDFVAFEGAGRTSRRPPKVAHVNRLGDECTGVEGLQTRLSAEAELQVHYSHNVHWGLRQTGLPLPQKVTQVSETVRLPSRRARFHLKVLAMDPGADLKVGWTWFIESPAGGAAAVGTPDCGIAMAICYSSGGEMKFGAQRGLAETFGVGDIITCELQTPESEGVPAQSLVAGFALNSKPLLTKHTWEFRELGALAFMLQTSFERHDGDLTLPSSESRRGVIKLIPTVFGKGFRVRALATEGLSELGRGHKKAPTMQGLEEDCLARVTTAVPRGGVEAFVELLRTGTPAARDAASLLFRGKAQVRKERGELVKMGVINLLVDFLVTGKVDEKTGHDPRQSAAMALASFAGEGAGTLEEQSEVVAGCAGGGKCIPALLAMVRSSTAPARQAAARALASIMSKNAAVQDQVVAADGMRALVDTVRSGSETAEWEQGQATSALSCLADHPVHKAALFKHDGIIEALVDMIKRASSSSSLPGALHLLGAYADGSPEHQARLAEADAVRLMVQQIGNHHGKAADVTYRAICRLLHGHVRNQERAVEHGALDPCCRDFHGLLMGRPRSEGTLKLLEELFALLVDGSEENPRKLSGVDDAKNGLKRLADNNDAWNRGRCGCGQLAGVLLMNLASNGEPQKREMASAWGKQWYDKMAKWKAEYDKGPSILQSMVSSLAG